MKFDPGFHSQTNGHANDSDKAQNDTIREMFLSSLAFVLYCPQAKTEKKMFYYNREALNVLSHTISPTPKNKIPSLCVSSLCSKWKKLLEEQIEKSSESNFENNLVTNTGIDFIDILQSHRRQYGIRVTILSPHIPNRQKQEKCYLFILERICVNYANLPMIIRSLKLNLREREIVALLFKGLCNKEMAQALGLSLNTIKVYLKFLMGKLGVNTRAGIISFLLSGKLRRMYSTDK